MEDRFTNHRFGLNFDHGIMNKNGLAGVAALGNMVGEIDDHDSRQTSHGENLPESWTLGVGS